MAIAGSHQAARRTVTQQDLGHGIKLLFRLDQVRRGTVAQRVDHNIGQPRGEPGFVPGCQDTHVPIFTAMAPMFANDAKRAVATTKGSTNRMGELL